MIPYFHKTPGWLKAFYPSFIWERSEESKTIYLTFDDGPITKVTPFVLNQLDKVGAKATFFCVGDNVRKNPSIFKEVVSLEHSIGNHTFHHLNGWNTDAEKYLENVAMCESEFYKNGVSSTLFRPPHGRIRKAQYAELNKQYQITMWSHLSGDFDPNLNIDKSFSEMKKANQGSILVFHDSLKAEHNLKKIIPDLLLYFQDLGFQFKSL